MRAQFMVMAPRTIRLSTAELLWFTEFVVRLKYMRATLRPQSTSMKRK